MKCRKVRPYLFSYFKNELSRDEKEKIKLHLESCPDCARDSLEVGRVSSLVKTSLETLTPSPDFNQKLLFEIQKLSLEKAKEVKSSSYFPLRIRWALAGSLAVIILASVLWFTHKPASFKPDATMAENKTMEGIQLVNREDSLNKELLKKSIEKSRYKTKTFVLDNFGMSGAQTIDERSIPENLSKRFILGTTSYQPEAIRMGNRYVLPVVSTQQVSAEVNY